MKASEATLEHLANSRLKSCGKDPVYCKQQLPMFGLNSREPSKPQTSEPRPRLVPKDHDSQKRFKAYQRAEEANRAREKSSASPVFDLDASISKARPNGLNIGFRTSHYPKSSLTPELERKVTVLSAYKALAASGDHSKDRNEPCRPSPPPRAKPPQARGDTFDLVSFKEALHMEKRCSDCKSSLCRCLKPVRDEYLRKMGRRISKSRAKIALREHAEIPDEKSKSRTRFRTSVQKSPPLNCSYESPHILPRHAYMRRSLGAESANERKRDCGFRCSTSGLESILQVSQASFSKKRRERRGKLDWRGEDTDDSDDLNGRVDLEEIEVREGEVIE